jgi:ABC-type protease/lipase transport system fused ATPase/permease subunit
MYKNIRIYPSNIRTSMIYMYASHSKNGMSLLHEITNIRTDLTDEEIFIFHTMLPIEMHYLNMPFVMHLSMAVLQEGSTCVLINNMSHVPHVTVKDANKSSLPCNDRVRMFIQICAQLGLCINKCIHVNSLLSQPHDQTSEPRCGLVHHMIKKLCYFKTSNVLVSTI